MYVILDDENNSFKSLVYNFVKDYFNKNKDINLKDLWQSLYKNSFISKENNFLKDILLVESCSSACPGLGLFLLTQFTCIEIIKNHANEKLKENCLNNLITGNSISCFALTEPNAGSDVSMIQTTAKNNNNNLPWTINGHKIWSSNGSVSDLIILFAQAKEYKNKTGITCFALNSKDKGIQIKPDTPKLGVKITPSNEIIINNLILSDETKIGKIGDGIKIALGAITLGRIYCASQAVGLLGGVLSEVIKHSTRRNQFGKSISENQAIQCYIAEMSKDISAAELLLYKAAWAKENNPKELNKLSSMSKYFSTSVSQKHSTKGVQILGGAGLNESSYVASAYRDAKVLEIYEGTNEIQKLILSKELLYA